MLEGGGEKSLLQVKKSAEALEACHLRMILYSYVTERSNYAQWRNDGTKNKGEKGVIYRRTLSVSMTIIDEKQKRAQVREAGRGYRIETRLRRKGWAAKHEERRGNQGKG